MRIVYIASNWGLRLGMTGGSGSHMRGTIKAFRAHGNQVLPIIGGDLMMSAGFKKANGVSSKTRQQTLVKKLMPWKIRLLLRDLRYYYRSLMFARKALPLISEFVPDVIYERSDFMSLAGRMVAEKLNIPLFVESDGHMVETYASFYGAFNQKLANAIERRKLAFAKRVVVMSQQAIKFVAEKHCQPEEKFVVKNLGVDRDAFVPDPALTSRIRNTLKLNGRFVVGFTAGLLQRYHGLNLILHIAKRLQSVHPEIAFLIVGGGALVEIYRQIAQNENLDNVVFTGLINKDEIASYMALFNIGIVPDCIPHMFPIKLPEYGILNLCPLAPDYPVFVHLFKFDGKEACLFTAKDSNSITQAICALADNPEQSRSLGKKWNCQVLEELTWEKTVRAVLKAMEEEIARAVPT